MKKMRKIGVQMEGQKFLVTTNLFHGGGFSFTLFHGLRLAQKNSVAVAVVVVVVAVIYLFVWFFCVLPKLLLWSKNDGPIRKNLTVRIIQEK